jgi:hypothetical protein
MQARHPFSGSTIVLSKLKQFPKVYPEVVAHKAKTTSRGPWHALSRLARRKCVEFLFRGKSYKVHIFKWLKSMRVEYVPSFGSSDVVHTDLAPLQLLVASPESTDVYLAELHKTKDHTGSELVNFAVELSRKLGAAKITLTDAATVSCFPSLPFMEVNLALVNALQGKPTFYERLGFVHTDQEAITLYRKTAFKAGQTSMKLLVGKLEEFIKLADKVKSNVDDYELVTPNIAWPMRPSVTLATRVKAEQLIRATKELVKVLVASLVLNSTLGSRTTQESFTPKTKSPTSPLSPPPSLSASSTFVDCTLSAFVNACMRRQDCQTINRLLKFNKATLGVRLKSSREVVYPTLFTKLYLVLPWYPHELEQAL